MDADDDNGEGAGAEERKPLRTSMVMGDHNGGNAPVPASAAARGLAPEDGYGDVASQAHTQAVSPRRLADSKSPARDGAVDDDGSASPTRGRRGETVTHDARGRGVRASATCVSLYSPLLRVSGCGANRHFDNHLARYANHCHCTKE
jgi:hypothetical protein